MNRTTKRAFYSQAAVDFGCGTSIFRRHDGTEVEVTAVHRDLSRDYREWYKWPDVIELGCVVEWIRIGRPTAPWLRVYP